MGEPRVGIDPEGLLLKGGAAWATAGLSLVATDIVRRLRATGDPCGAVSGRADQPAEPLEELPRALPEPGEPAAAANRP